MNKCFFLMVLTSALFFGLVSLPGCKKDAPTPTTPKEPSDKDPNDPGKSGNEPTPVAAGSFFSGTSFEGWTGDRTVWSVDEGSIIGMREIKAKDGAEGKGKKGASTVMFSDKKYSDFELKVQVKATGESSSGGILIRGTVEDANTYSAKGPRGTLGTLQWGDLIEPKGGAKGGAAKGGADKGGADKGGADKGKGGKAKGGADKGGADKGGADKGKGGKAKGGADKGGADKGAAKGAPKGFASQNYKSEVASEALKFGEFNDYEIKAVGKHVTIKLNNQTTLDDNFPTLPESGVIGFQMIGTDMRVIFKNIQFTDLSKK